MNRVSSSGPRRRLGRCTARSPRPCARGPPARDHGLDRRLDHPGERAAPAGMGGADHAGVRIRQQHRRAVGREHAERDAGTVGNQRIGLERRPSRLRRARDRPWYRGPGAPCTGCRAPCRGARRARPVRLHPPDVIAARVAAVERGESPSLTPPVRVKKPWRTRPRARGWRGQHGRSVGAWNRRRRRVGPGEHQHLEQLAHGARVGQAEQGRAQRALLSGVARSISFAVRRWMPSVVKTCPAAPARRRCAACGRGRNAKVDVGGRSAVPGASSGSHGACRRVACKVSPVGPSAQAP